jgi:acetyl esterase/lipase
MSALSVTNAPQAITQAGAPAAAPAAPRAPEPGYLDGADRTQFIVSPTVDETLLAKWPPTIFFTGTRDFAMSGALFSYRKLIKLGVDSQLMVFDGLYHGFMTNPDFPEAQEGYKTAAAFYDKHLGK